MTLRTMDFFPAPKGLVASPFFLGGIRKLSLSVAIGWTLSVVCWWLGKRKGLVIHRKVVEEG